MNRRWVALVVLPLLFLTAACGDDEPSTESTKGSAALTEINDGGTERVKVGDTVVISLETAGGAGYSWKVTTDPDPKVLEFMSQSQARTGTTQAGSPPLVGAPETVDTTFTAVGKGTTKVVLGHVPPAGGEPEDTFTVTVIVE